MDKKAAELPISTIIIIILVIIVLVVVGIFFFVQFGASANQIGQSSGIVQTGVKNLSQASTGVVT